MSLRFAPVLWCLLLGMIISLTSASPFNAVIASLSSQVCGIHQYCVIPADFQNNPTHTCVDSIPSNSTMNSVYSVDCLSSNNLIRGPSNALDSSHSFWIQKQNDQNLCYAGDYKDRCTLGDCFDYVVSTATFTTCDTTDTDQLLTVYDALWIIYSLSPAYQYMCNPLFEALDSCNSYDEDGRSGFQGLSVSASNTFILDPDSGFLINFSLGLCVDSTDPTSLIMAKCNATNPNMRYTAIEIAPLPKSNAALLPLIALVAVPVIVAILALFLWRRRRATIGANSMSMQGKLKGQKPFMVLSAKYLKAASRLPPFSEVATKLVVPKSRDKVTFISHKWYGLNAPDSSDNRFLTWIKSRFEDDTLLWIDYCSIPSDLNIEETTAYIKSIPFFLSCCERVEAFTFEIDAYMGSAWCYFEALCHKEGLAKVWVMGSENKEPILSDVSADLRIVKATHFADYQALMPHLKRRLKALGYSKQELSRWEEACGVVNRPDHADLWHLSPAADPGNQIASNRGGAIQPAAMTPAANPATQAHNLPASRPVAQSPKDSIFSDFRRALFSNPNNTDALVNRALNIK